MGKVLKFPLVWAEAVQLQSVFGARHNLSPN